MTRLSILSGNMTLSDRSYPILFGKTVIGAVIRNADGRYVGWSNRARVGEYATAIEAERAVHAERAAQKKKKAAS